MLLNRDNVVFFWAGEKYGASMRSVKSIEYMKKKFPAFLVLMSHLFFLVITCPALELGQDPREIYVLKTTQWRQPVRLVLNARRPVFDLPEGGYSRQGKRVNDNNTTDAGVPTGTHG